MSLHHSKKQFRFYGLADIALKGFSHETYEMGLSPELYCCRSSFRTMLNYSQIFLSLSVRIRNVLIRIRICTLGLRIRVFSSVTLKIPKKIIFSYFSAYYRYLL
jgi:hypothetical protein